MVSIGSRLCRGNAFQLARWLLLGMTLAGISASMPAQRGPVINERFPIKGGSVLSPPIVWPVGDCAKAVHVSGFIPHANVRVFVNTTTQVGIANPYFAEADIAVSPGLKLGDVVTATQEVMGFTSNPTVNPVTVGPYPSILNKPNVLQPLYACGQVVPVDNLNPGTVVEVSRNGSPGSIGQSNVTTPWTPVVTASLNQPDQVTARQTACSDDPSKKKVSPPSDPKGVFAEPSPMVPPTVWSYPPGADTIVLDGLYIGSLDQVLNGGGTQVGIGLSNSKANKFGISPPAGSSSDISGSQKLCSSSGPGPSVKPSSTLSAPAIVPPVCEAQPYVTVANSYPNSILVLFRNGSIAGMAGGDLGDVKMALGGGVNFALGDAIWVVQYVGNVISSPTATVYANCAPQNVITQHNDNRRSGAYLAEAALTPVNVNPSTFGRLYTRQVDGDTMSQPLYMRGVRTAAGLKNLFFVTTSKNNVYAFDATNKSTAPSAGLIWSRNLCGSVPSGVCGETPSRLVGITSTPVIDPSTQVMYVVARCSDGKGGRLDGAILVYALNVSDGTDFVPPVQVQATDPGDSSIQFDFHCQRNRPGLLLSKGVMYAAFATFSCDAGCANAPYRGWVIGYRESDLEQVAVFDTAPHAGQVGIWQTGNGLVADDNGSIYFQTGNGPPSEPLQDSFVKLVLTNAPGGLALGGSFQPNNASTAPAGRRSLTDGDTDLGSGGPMLLPGGRLIGGGKQGRYYVMDTGSMNLTQDSMPDALGFDGFQAFTNQYHNDSSQPACAAAGGAAGCAPSGAGGRCFIERGRYGDGELCGPNIHGGPIYWQKDSSSGTIFEMPEKDFLQGFRYDLSSHHVTQSVALRASGAFAKPPTDGMPGGFSSLSARRRVNGIVWTSMPVGDGQWAAVPGRLAAFDAVTLHELWNDDDNVAFAKSVPPTIADGNVIRATASNLVVVYGLFHRFGHPFPPPSLVAKCYKLEEKYENFGGEVGLLGRPTGTERRTDDTNEGVYRDYRGDLPGMTSTITSQKEPHDLPMPTCSMPPGKATWVDSSIYFTKATCAHVVMGEIRELWLKLGGPKSRLGYPTGDETYTSDHYGRMSEFQHGEIIWYPNKGAYARYKTREPEKKADKDHRQNLK